MTVVLPDSSTEAGAVCRLLLAETRGPAYKSYNQSTARQAMGWMKRVLANRLANKPGQFYAPHAKNLTGIIKAGPPEQFAGFMSYPNYDPDIVALLQKILGIANSTKDGRSVAYEGFVKDAIAVAGAPAPADPSDTGLYGWRTEGRGSPGGRFVVYKTVGGNTFYTLTD